MLATEVGDEEKRSTDVFVYSSLLVCLVSFFFKYSNQPLTIWVMLATQIASSLMIEQVKTPISIGAMLSINISFLPILIVKVQSQLLQNLFGTSGHFNLLISSLILSSLLSEAMIFWLDT